MSDIEISDGEADDWFAANLPARPQEGDPPGPVRRGSLHLLLGDSIARRAGVAARSGDQVLNRAWRGATWTELHDRVGREIAAWQTAAAASDLALGRIVIWLTGNDVHNKESYLASSDREKVLRIGLIAREVVLEVMLHGDVCILGPLPRLAGHAAEATGGNRRPHTTWRERC